ncbi:hypothetical protein [Francisella sp. 19X1-34]|uniref:hypothetical protein n=1 Tax=Francisella sp. 19X1-34 TaxID=3087177 RepID=UPI002E32A06D|nr:hypothetical protein [Francisella sp. 19X1-34]MED7788554.1 hypothetical protein [Francisella sp. 19X1-34]
MKVLLLRGYKSQTYEEKIMKIANITVDVIIRSINKSILVKKHLSKILSHYNLDDFDMIYLASLSACATSIIDQKHAHKITLIAPFFLTLISIRNLTKQPPNFKLGGYKLESI